VLVAISIAAGVISLLVPALLRQVAIGEESNRLKAVEAAVSSDLYRFSNYAKIWKQKAGSSLKSDSISSIEASKKLTKTSEYVQIANAIYDPPDVECKEPFDSPNGLAASLLSDGLSQNPKVFGPTSQFAIGKETPILEDNDPAIKVLGSNVLRTVNAKGSKIIIFYRLENNAYGISFAQTSSILVEASSWCDQLS
jgi:hypothetical protein